MHLKETSGRLGRNPGTRSDDDAIPNARQTMKIRLAVALVHQGHRKHLAKKASSIGMKSPPIQNLSSLSFSESDMMTTRFC